MRQPTIHFAKVVAALVVVLAAFALPANAAPGTGGAQSGIHQSAQPVPQVRAYSPTPSRSGSGTTKPAGLKPISPLAAAQGDIPVVLYNYNSGWCLGVWGNSRTAGASVTTWDCDGGADKIWHLQSLGQGFFSVRNHNSGMCLGVLGGSTTPGAHLVQWPCAGGINDQAWSQPYTGYYGGDGNPLWYVQNYDSQVMGVLGGSTAKAATIVQWPAAYPKAPGDQGWEFWAA
ncbi:RICIN domain-containing protein [Lentzea sp. NPDC004782]|uniref:RICIN domain-containing protein n=1 Tax=Lentzea sp. NPDC004782 TaxID=3154458 RepID=UPI0033BB40D2